MQVLEIQPRDLEDSAQNVAEAKIDPAFRKLSKNAICFHIWKVEQDRIELLPKGSYDSFFDDCTYIIYAASLVGSFSHQDTITREMKPSVGIERFIHFWLGSNTTSQKSGNVAYKVMELDTHFGHCTTQYRESQGNESCRFLSYFKKGITILSSELVNTKRECRLYRASGNKWTNCVEMDSVSWDHFGSSYILILRTPKYVFVWIGRSTSSTERRNAWEIAVKIQEKFLISDISIVDDGYEQSMNEAQKQEWNMYLSLKNRFVSQVGPVCQSSVVPLKLYRCGYFNGKYRIEEIKTDEPEQSDLNDPEGAYIVDGSVNGVWIWVGRKASLQEKVEAMRNARGFVKKKKYPSITPVMKIAGGYEPLEFMRLFPVWKRLENSPSRMSNILGKLDSMTLLQRPKMAAELQLIDDGTGEKHIYRITDGKYVELPKQKHIAFFSGDCYLLHYVVNALGSQNSNQGIETSELQNVLYVWCGSETNNERRQKCDAMAQEYFTKLGKSSMMVKLVDGLETAHFLQIFNGKFVVFSGQGSEYDRNGISSQMLSGFILKVFGDSTYNSKAVQQDSLMVLSPKDCFVIKSQSVWVWCGQSSTGDAREVAKSIGSLLGEYTLVMESKEPEDFWKSVVGKFIKEHANGFAGSVSPIERPSTNIDKCRVGLYIAYVNNLGIVTKEVLGFEQSDLTPEDIYLLDVGNMIFIWLGALSTANHSEILCWVIARDFLQKFAVQRDENTAVALVRQEYEPNIFTGLFNDWNHNLWKMYAPFETIRKQLESCVSPVAGLPLSVNGENDFDKHQKYPLSILQQEADALPSGVIPTKKEVHLTHDDFVSVFNMRYTEFNTLPAWKKQELKKKHKLF